MPDSDQQLLLANLILLILNVAFIGYAFSKLSRFVKSIYQFMKELKLFLDKEMHEEDPDSTKKP